MEKNKITAITPEMALGKRSAKLVKPNNLNEAKSTYGYTVVWPSANEENGLYE